MIPKECKRLVEVDFPIAEVSKHAAREKSIRHGHPSTLHLWWARRPLASSRAVLMALLLPDPCDEQCPKEFKKQAREILGEVRQPPKSDEDLQKALLWFIGSFANWDMSAHPVYLKVARNLVRAAHPEETPLVVDPFAGGGSIPLEALRLGCEAFASDLNPVACLILKVMLEDIPCHGPELAEELRKVGGEIKAAAEKELADLYPTDPDGATPIAYLWARTIRCESPNCGAEIPLIRSNWLSKKKTSRTAIQWTVDRSVQPPEILLEIVHPQDASGVQEGTVTQGRATCIACGTTVTPDRVKAQLAEDFGGANPRLDETNDRIGGAMLLAVVLRRDGARGKSYRTATAADYEAVGRAHSRWNKCQARLPHEPMGGPRHRDGSSARANFSFMPIRLYGLRHWGDIFSERQQLALQSLANQLAQRSGSVASGVMACVLGRCTDYWSANAMWARGGEFVAHTFGRQALPMVWDFAEVAPFSGGSGSFQSALGWVGRVIESLAVIGTGAQTQIADARESPLPDESASVWFTDPPYYDAVPYAYLSDFFLVWHKRAVPEGAWLGDPFDPDNPLSPKIQEIIDDRELFRGAPKDKAEELGFLLKDRAFFEKEMARSFGEGNRILKDDGVACVVFAHKTTEGWEALLGGLTQSGWTVTASWPIATERPGRLRAQDSAALETSVHLICRPRPEDAPVGDWADVLRELPPRVAAWMERLQDEGIRGADLVFACIGPALEIFSRYRAVETAEGREVGLPEYLEKVWEVVSRSALERVLGNGDASASALEEDARLTALFLWTLQSTEIAEANAKKEEEDEDAVAKVAAKGFSLPYDMVRRFAQPMGIDLDAWTGRVIDQDKGVVRLLPVAERAKALFGEDGTRGAADWIESDTGGDLQGMLFPDMEAAPKKKSRGRGRKAILSGDGELQSPDATTLDRVHAAMLLQSSGQANALRKLIGAEQDRGPDFLRLANALSALYPKGSEEKRLLDAMLLAVPR